MSQQRITSVAVNVTGEWLAFGCSSLGQLLVWEWQSESYVLKQQGHYYHMNCLAYSPDGQLIATGGDDGKVNLVMRVGKWSSNLQMRLYCAQLGGWDTLVFSTLGSALSIKV